jgi:hypothetical protein
VVTALAGPAPAAAPSASSTSPSPSSDRRTSVVRAGCIDVAHDLAKRAPDAKPESSPIDLDGDGVTDPVFSGSCSMMGGNCDTYLYASNDGCPRFVGVVQVTQVSSGPRCVEPAKGRVPCRLSASRMMIHGEIYEYFYEHGPDGYVEAGVGHRGAPERH